MTNTTQNVLNPTQETTIQLGDTIAIGQFGQVKESAKPGVYNVTRLNHEWNGIACGSAYLFTHELIDTEVSDILKSIDYECSARTDGEGYGLFSMDDDTFDALDKAWYTTPKDNTGFVVDDGDATFAIYTNAERTVFLLDGDYIYLHSLLWPQWSQMTEEQYIADHIRDWDVEEDEVVVAYYDANNNYQNNIAKVAPEQRKIDVVVQSMLTVIDELRQSLTHEDRANIIDDLSEIPIEYGN